MARTIDGGIEYHPERKGMKVFKAAETGCTLKPEQRRSGFAATAGCCEEIAAQGLRIRDALNALISRVTQVGEWFEHDRLPPAVELDTLAQLAVDTAGTMQAFGFNIAALCCQCDMMKGDSGHFVGIVRADDDTRPA